MAQPQMMCSCIHVELFVERSAIQVAEGELSVVRTLGWLPLVVLRDGGVTGAHVSAMSDVAIDSSTI